MRRRITLVALLGALILLGGCSWSSYHVGYRTGYGLDNGYCGPSGHYDGHGFTSFRYRSSGGDYGQHGHHRSHRGHRRH
jgi:hypothetical protein